jgi:hypothetical protein
MSAFATGTIVKIDEEKKLVFGWASVIKDAQDKVLLDRQDDFIDSEEELEKAAYQYVLKSRDGGEMHIRKGVSTMVESVVLSKEKQAALGIPAGVVPIGWWIGFKVNDDRVWNEVKKGGYSGFSVHGTGKREKTNLAIESVTEIEKCGCDSVQSAPHRLAKEDSRYWKLMNRAQISIMKSLEESLEKGDYPGHPFRGNQWTRGKGSAGSGGGKAKKPKMKRGAKLKSPPSKSDVREATKRLLAGEEVDLPDIKGAHTLIKKLAKVAQQAEKSGKKFNYDLCKVTVKGSSAFCGGNKGIDRADMPQAKGDAVKGSKAEKLLAKQNAKRKAEGKEPKTEVDATKEFIAHMEKNGIKVGKPTAMRSDKLKATQRNMQGEKVAGMMGAKKKDFLKEPIFVSRDGYVVDGHHRWAANLGLDMKDGKLGNNYKQNVIVLDAPISKILKEANRFTTEFGIARKKVAGK